MTHPYWPLFDLRLSTGGISLRPVTETDLVALADLRPADAETDPRLPTFGVADPHLAAGTATFQAYWSSLGPGWRGRGVGRAMRLCVLALAFDGLGAQAAQTSAWPDNAASLGVSRSLGYADNGVVRHHARGRVADMPRMRLTRQVFAERHHRHGVRITGLDRCRHLFGVPDDVTGG